MRSILTVTTPASVTRLATLERVKRELGITDTASDVVLGEKLDEASSDIEAALRFRVPRETVTETFWPHEAGDAFEFLTLDRTPVVSIDSVTLDDFALDSSLYRLDHTSGQLFALDASGYQWRWLICKALVISYTGGFLLPGQQGRDLPRGIEGATVELMQSYWASKGRDPMVKQENIPGVRDVTYWVGAVGEEGELPPNVVARLAPYRRGIA